MIMYKWFIRIDFLVTINISICQMAAVLKLFCKIHNCWYEFERILNYVTLGTSIFAAIMLLAVIILSIVVAYRNHKSK